MPHKRFKTEEIIQKLREAKVLLSQGQRRSLTLLPSTPMAPPGVLD